MQGRKAGLGEMTFEVLRIKWVKLGVMVKGCVIFAKDFTSPASMVSSIKWGWWEFFSRKAGVVSVKLVNHVMCIHSNYVPVP